MKIIVQSPHFKVEERLTELINRKVNKLTQFNERILKAEVTLRFEKSDTENDKVCEIRLLAPEKVFFAIRRCLTFDDAVTQTVKALELQLEKQKTRREKTGESIIINEDTGESNINTPDFSEEELD